MPCPVSAAKRAYQEPIGLHPIETVASMCQLGGTRAVATGALDSILISAITPARQPGNLADALPRLALPA